MHISSSSTAHTLAFTLALALVAVVRVLGDIDQRPSSGGLAARQPIDACTGFPPGSEISEHGVREDLLGVEHHTTASQPLSSIESGSPMCIAGTSRLPRRVP